MMQSSVGAGTFDYDRSALLGFVAGLRSQLPLALLAAAANRGAFAKDATGPLRLLRSRWVLAGSVTAAVGEMIADKLPFTPSRLQPGAFVGRVVFGAVAGAALARGAGRPFVPGAIVGALGAGAGTYAGHNTRQELDRLTGWPDPIWGGVEDAVAIGLGVVAIEAGSRQGGEAGRREDGADT